MKIYPVEYEEYVIFPDNIKKEWLGVFSSAEKAKEGIIRFAKSNYIGSINYWRILEYYMDDENYGEEVEIINKKDIYKKVRELKEEELKNLGYEEISEGQKEENIKNILEQFLKTTNNDE